MWNYLIDLVQVVSLWKLKTVYSLFIDRNMTTTKVGLLNLTEELVNDTIFLPLYDKTVFRYKLLLIFLMRLLMNNLIILKENL
ncbi:hypothetical protein Lsai_0189 [Legionella sainthelensi]|uniref:Uncharacterized protein n=1 Tax=Legionella sainthelensi TaxID=28087 RepID=A0A0W0YTP7_9GAMM|nr:hypothetical protein Lsai_0189 [Legionella sainthelensi]VEH32887.1 Uncharacterised protein [Legionella sainthelensi]